MKAHMEKACQGLGDLGVLAEKTEKAERAILKRAEARLVEVSGLIERGQPGVEAADDAVQKRYLDLVAERGQLHTVIAKARQVLA